MQYIKFHMSFDQRWLATVRCIYITFTFINLECDFLFREWAALKFLDSACFPKFSPIKKQFDAPKHHNLGLLFFYEIMSLANFGILSRNKFEN